MSLTEVSEYAAGVPEEMKQARLYPRLPPEGMDAFCFYPMSKRRAPGAENWYALSFDDRLELMKGHGAAGREFRGRVLQLVTGSTGLDDFEWGVTLFGVHPDDLKDCVYSMRFDEASTRYGGVRALLHRHGRRGRGRSRRRRHTLKPCRPTTPQARLREALGAT